MIERIVNLLFDQLVRFIPDPRKRPAWFFAHLGAPSLVLVLAGSIGSGIAVGGDSGIAFAPLATRIEENTVAEQNGYVLIIDRSATRFSLPLQDTGNAIAWTSLDATMLAANSANLVVRHDAVAIDEMPLLGVQDPVVLVGTGRPAAELHLPGKKVALEQLRIPPVESGALALAGVVAATLGFGISIGSKEPGVRQERGADERRREDEN